MNNKLQFENFRKYALSELKYHRAKLAELQKGENLRAIKLWRARVNHWEMISGHITRLEALGGTR